MSERIAAAARFSRMVDAHRERCNARNCVNWSCDGTRHRDYAGRKWGIGWHRGPFPMHETGR